MLDQIFHANPRPLQFDYIQTLACHYLMQLKNPDQSLSVTGAVLGLSRSTITDHWNALEAHYGLALVERGAKRSGRLTPFGKMVGALAAHFVSYDYVLRNGDQVEALGDHWALGLIEETNRMGTAAETIISLMNTDVDVVREEDMEKNT